MIITGDNEGDFRAITQVSKWNDRLSARDMYVLDFLAAILVLSRERPDLHRIEYLANRREKVQMNDWSYRLLRDWALEAPHMTDRTRRGVIALINGVERADANLILSAGAGS